MQLGTQTASLVNNIYSRATIGQPRPEVGMGATVLGWTDRYPCTITKAIEFGGSKQWSYEIEVVEDAYKVVRGSVQDGSAEYEFSPRDGSSSLYRFNKKTNSWVAGYISKETNRFCVYKGGPGLIIGKREKYYDPSF